MARFEANAFVRYTTAAKERSIDPSDDRIFQVIEAEPGYVKMRLFRFNRPQHEIFYCLYPGQLELVE